MSFLRIPKDGRSVLLVAIAWWLLSPISEGVFYYTNRLRGEYPPPGDHIQIPITLFFIGWLMLTPVLVALVGFCLWQYPGPVSLFAFNTARPAWSAAWTLAVLIYLYHEIPFFYASVRDRYPMDLITGLVEVYLMLCLRSSVIYSSRFMRKDRKPQPA